jgi:anti-sigma factor RsiW
MLRGRDHPTDEELLPYADGTADEATIARVRGHLEAGCRRCAAELETWTRLVGGLTADREPGAPEAVLRRAFALIHGLEVQPSPVQRLLAALRFDSRGQLAPAGARDALGGSYHQLYGAGEETVELLVEAPAAGSAGWRITGMVSSTAAPELGWSIHGAGPRGLFEGRTDAAGEYTLSDLPCGRYDLEFRAGGREIVVKGIELGQSAQG